MNELVMYLYGISTGMIIFGILLYAKRQVEKAIYHGFAGSAPTLKNTINQRVKRGKLPY
jgi:hypothetical protein